MKPIKTNRFSLALAASSLLFGGVLYAQTVEINPAGTIPAAYTLAQGWEWNTAGDLEGWAAGGNEAFVLNPGTPTDGTVIGTSAPGTQNNSDATFTSPLTTIATPYRVIVEMRIKKPSTDNSRIDLFWDDVAGGFAGGRMFSVQPESIAADDTFKVVRITFPYGRIVTQLDRLRLDPATLPDQTVEMDYLRVYTETRDSLQWDPNTAVAGAQGGSGTWDELTNTLWWNGTANTTWPASNAFTAEFGGTAGTVTVEGGGVNASLLNFNTEGYTVEGGPIHLGTDSAAFSTPGAASAGAAVATRINSALTGTAPLTFRTSGSNGAYVLAGSSPSYSGAVTFASSSLGILQDDALGTGTVTFGTGGNVYIHALDGDRTLTNDVILAGNRILIGNTDLGTGANVGDLTMDGDLTLNNIAPGEIYLRQNLTVNGVVSGSNNNIGLFLGGNPGTLRLTNSNTFSGGIQWNISAVLEANSDAALGAAGNNLTFNANQGALRLLADFDSARAININGATVGRIDTNGFDSTWSGGINGTNTAGINSRFFKQGEGTLTLQGVNILGGGTQIQAGTLEIPTGAALTHGTFWDNNHGVGGGATFLLNGGTFTITGSFLGIGNLAEIDSEALFQMDAGTYNHIGGSVLVGFRAPGRWVLNGGSADVNQIGYGDGDSSRTAVIELNGGTLTMDTAARRTGDATATIKLNGTTLVAKSDQPDYLPVGSAGITELLVGTGGANFNTASFSIGIANPLGHDPELGATPDGGLTKSGAGILSLDAANTYTGTTTVNEGTLVVTGESITNTGNLVINTGGIVEVTADETVNTLFFGGSPQIAGTYGSETSSATFQSARFAGSAVLTVLTTGEAGGYSAWAATNAGNQSADLDFDNDGVSNGVEYFMGATGSAFTPNPGVSAGTITWPKDPAFVGTFKVQVSDTLAPGGWTDIVPPNASIDESNPNQVVHTLPAGSPKKFARLNVTVTP